MRLVFAAMAATIVSSSALASYVESFESGLNGWSNSGTGLFAVHTGPGAAYDGQSYIYGECGSIGEAWLKSPQFTADAATTTLSMAHYYTLEWYEDTAQITLSVNGGAYFPVDGSCLSGRNYQFGTSFAGNNYMAAIEPQVTSTANYYLTSADLSSYVNPGDQFSVRFLLTSDYDYPSRWMIDSVALTGVSVPEPTSLGVLGLGAISLLKRRRGTLA